MAVRRHYEGGETIHVIRQSGQKNRVYKEGRKCRWCGVGLSRYNKGPNCFMHSKPQYRAAREQR